MKEYEIQSDADYRDNWFVLQLRYKNNGWRIVRVDHENRESHIGNGYDTKEEAKQNGRRLCKKNRPASLQIYKKDGSFQTNHFYPSKTY